MLCFLIDVNDGEVVMECDGAGADLCELFMREGERGMDMAAQEHVDEFVVGECPESLIAVDASSPVEPVAVFHEDWEMRDEDIESIIAFGLLELLFKCIYLRLRGLSA